LGAADLSIYLLYPSHSDSSYLKKLSTKLFLVSLSRRFPELLLEYVEIRAFTILESEYTILLCPYCRRPVVLSGAVRMVLLTPLLVLPPPFLVNLKEYTISRHSSHAPTKVVVARTSQDGWRAILARPYVTSA